MMEGLRANLRRRRRRLISFMIDFSIIRMCLFYVLQHQFRANKRVSRRPAPADWPEQRQRKLEHLLEQRSIKGGSRLPPTSEPPLKRLLRLKKLAHGVYKLQMWFFAIELVRYLLIELLNMEALQDYQLLDCFILGRFRFIGRTNKISSRIILVFIAVFASYHILTFRVVPEFRFYALEFLMHDHEEVVLNEIEFEARNQQGGRAERATSEGNSGKIEAPLELRIGHLDALSSVSNFKLGRNLSSDNGEQGADPFDQLEPIFNLRSPFGRPGETSVPLAAARTRTNSCDKWILRPNRTAENWRLLALFTEVALYCSIGISLGWLVLIHRTINGSILTDLGYELSYSACVGWLQRHQHQQQPQPQPQSSPGLEGPAVPPYASIYVAPALLANQRNIDDIPAIISVSELGASSQPGFYYFVRVFLDFLANSCWYTEFILIATSITYLLFISSLDVILNASEIKRRLVAIVSKLGRLRETRRLTGNLVSFMCEIDRRQEVGAKARVRPKGMEDAAASARWQSSGGQCQRQRQRHELSGQIADIQAILADHFKLVRGYNKFVNFALTLILGTWCVYSAVLCSWMISTQSRAVEFEFLLTEMGGTFFAVAFFAQVAVTRSLNYNLHSLIARAMALDDDNSPTKMRWTTIMKFYAPKSMYCFTLMGSTEISWLFCLQFVWWIVSAYIVLTNFFYTNRH